VRRDFHRQAIGLGLLKSVSARDYLKNPRRFSRFDAIGAGRDLLDPEASRTPRPGLLRTCLTTLKAAVRQNGPALAARSAANRARKPRSRRAGISLDLSKGQGGQTVGNTRSKPIRKPREPLNQLRTSPRTGRQAALDRARRKGGQEVKKHLRRRFKACFHQMLASEQLLAIHEPALGALLA
jgi:hypothetical protein